MATGGKLSSCLAEYATKEGQLTTKDVTLLLTHAGICKKTGKWTSNSMDICFCKHKTKGKNVITCEQFENFIKDMCAAKPADDFEKICEKLCNTKKCDHIKTKTSKTGGVDRLTDTSNYTGAHKERFNADGTGKGADGRTDKVDNSGYVGAYKGEGTKK